MSDLPRYTRTPNADESETEALVKKGRDSFDVDIEDEAEAEAPSYPPRAGPSGTGLKNVTYEIQPQYPLNGTHQRVLGILGRDKDETIMLVRKVFDVLEDIPDERISFQASFGESPPNWSRIMDEVWPQFAERPPTGIFVTIKDGPGYEAARFKNNIMIFVIVLCMFGAFIGLIFWLFPGDPKKISS